jgi:hypothetical protein
MVCATGDAGGFCCLPVVAHHLNINAVELVKASPGTTLGKATEKLAHELREQQGTP